jgi:hypothetical protein
MAPRRANCPLAACRPAGMACCAVDIHGTIPLVVGWLLLVAGLGWYLGSIGAAVWRIHQQYSRSMVGGRGMGTAAGLSAAVRRSPLLLVAVAGLLLLHAAT